MIVSTRCCSPLSVAKEDAERQMTLRALHNQREMVTDALPLAAHTVAFCIARQQSVRRPCTTRSQWDHLTLHTLSGVHRHRQPQSHHILPPHTLSIHIPIKTHPDTYHIRAGLTWMRFRVHWPPSRDNTNSLDGVKRPRSDIPVRAGTSSVGMTRDLCVVGTHFPGPTHHGNDVQIGGWPQCHGTRSDADSNDRDSFIESSLTVPHDLRGRRVGWWSTLTLTVWAGFVLETEPKMVSEPNWFIRRRIDGDRYRIDK